MLGLGLTQGRAAVTLSLSGYPSSISAPQVSKTSSAGVNPITVDILLPDNIVHASNKLRAQRTNDESAPGVPNWSGTSVLSDLQSAGDDGMSVVFSVLTGPMPLAPNYLRFAEETGDATLGQRGTVVSPWSNVVSDTFSASNASLNPITITLGTSWYGNANPPYAGFYMGLFFAAHPEHTLLNMGLGGSGLTYLRSRVPDIIAAKPYVFCCEEGPNDFMNDNGTFVPSGGSKQALYDAYVAYFKSCLDDIKAGCPGIAIQLETITERHAADGGADGSGGYNDLYNLWRPTFNAQIMTWKASGFVAQVANIGGEATIGAVGHMQPGSPESPEGLHLSEAASGPTTAGHYKAYQVFAPSLLALYAATPLPAGSGDPDVSSFAISPTSVTHNEGDSGSTAYLYTVTRTGGVSFAAAIDYAVTGTGSNPATGADFVGGSLPTGTVTFAAGAATTTIPINVQGDSTVEPDEDFLVTLTNGRTIGTITTATATGRITNDDAGGGTVGFTALTPPTFQHGATYNGLTIPAAGRFLVFMYESLGRIAASASLTPAGGGSAIAGTVRSTNDAMQLWEFVIPASGNYNLAFTPAGSNFYLTGILPVLITGASAALAAIQTKPNGNTNNPASTSTSLVVASGGLGVVFSAINATSAAISGRLDGGTNRSSLYITDDGGNANPTLISFATLTATGTPSFTFTPDAGEAVGIIAGAY